MRFKSLDSYMNALDSWTQDMIRRRTASDIFEELTQSFLESTHNKYMEENKMKRLAIKKVIYKNPATIVYWNGGEKTVVKCGENETFDPEKGLAMAIIKHLLGNEGNYYNEFKKFLPNEDVETEPVTVDYTSNKRK